MTQRPHCRCGQLAKHAAEDGVPFRFHPATHSYSLDLPDRSILNAYCVFCGGFKDAPLTENPPLCRCGFLEEAAKQEGGPITWDGYTTTAFSHSVCNMYGLQCSSPNYQVLIIWFCPVCGGRANDQVPLGVPFEP